MRGEDQFIMDSLSPFTAISPIDGRYRNKTFELSEYFSEFGLMKSRVFVEIEWLIYQVKIGITPIDVLSEEDMEFITSIKNLSIQQFVEIKNHEKITLHDVKAVEYYIKDKLRNSNNRKLKQLVENVHFLVTSEDINSPSYSLTIKHSIEKVIRPELAKVIEKLTSIATNYAEDPLLALTHGQPATPTTVGKEMAIYVKRLSDQLKNNLDKLKYYGKFGGATGNYNAHAFIYPDKNWPELCDMFVEEHLGLSYSSYTTQSESHDFISLICDTISRINSIICDLSVDMWLYISRNVIVLKTEKGQVGSSTMPHKINPYQFENAEGNSEISIAILQFLSRKLLRSRLQRDLSDSTCLRNIGVAFAHTLVSLKSLNSGLDKICINKDQLQNELDKNWSVLAEPFQLCLKKSGINVAFEKVQSLFMGKSVQKSNIKNIIHELCQGDTKLEDKLSKLTPQNYIGYSPELAKKVSDSYNIQYDYNMASLMGDDSCDDVSDGQSSGIFEKNPSILTKSEGATSENTESTPKIQYTLTPEEAQLKALELQKKLRNERERCEKRNELERERNRMAMGQAIQQQRELFAEQERKRQIEETCKMKMEWEKEKQIQLDLLKKEYKEKFGTDYIEEEDVAEELSDNKRRQKLASICGRITVKYKDSKDVLCLCIKILKLYLSNIIKFPLEQRYKTIKKSNATFSNKVIGPIPEIAELLVYCGFKETDTEFRVEGQAKIYVMSCAITYLDIILKQD